MELSGELSSLSCQGQLFVTELYVQVIIIIKLLRVICSYCLKMIKMIIITSTITTTATSFIQQPYPQDLNEMFSD